MKTAQQYLEAECPVFEPLFADEATRVLGQDIIKAMKAYAQSCCKEQREICAGHYNHYTKDTDLSILVKIKNAPEPTML